MGFFCVPGGENFNIQAVHMGRLGKGEGAVLRGASSWCCWVCGRGVVLQRRRWGVPRLDGEDRRNPFMNRRACQEEAVNCCCIQIFLKGGLCCENVV